MQDSTVTLLTPASGIVDPVREGGRSATSWGSILGGALATLAVSVILVTLGGSLGLMPTSPPDTDRTMAVMGSLAAIWLIVTQWIASAVGGYLTGRLRTKWVSVHSHEVFFRDTAHGFLAWSAAMLCGLALLSSTVGSALGHMPHGSGMHGPGAMGDNGPTAYYVDSLFRGASPPNGAASEPVSSAAAPESVPVSGMEPPVTAAGASGAIMAPVVAMPPARIPPELRAETSRILARGMATDGISDEDKHYLAQLVSEHTSLSLPEASQRVNSVLAQATNDGQKAHKAIGYVSLFAALSMLIGAFVACAAAGLGGAQRDEWEEAVQRGTYLIK